MIPRKRCPNPACGKMIPYDATVCPECSTPIAAPSQFPRRVCPACNGPLTYDATTDVWECPTHGGFTAKIGRGAGPAAGLPPGSLAKFQEWEDSKRLKKAILPPKKEEEEAKKPVWEHGIHVTNIHVKERLVEMGILFAAALIAGIFNFIWLGIGLIFLAFYITMPSEAEVMESVRAGHFPRLKREMIQLMKSGLSVQDAVAVLKGGGVPIENIVRILLEAGQELPGQQGEIRRIKVELTGGK